MTTVSAPDLVDLTHSLDQGIPVYPGDPPFDCVPYCTVPVAGYSVHSLALSSHAGTHIDAPSHFFSHLATIDQLPLSTFVRPVLVLDMSHKKSREKIAWRDVQAYEEKMREGIAVLIWTGWSQFWGTDKYFDHPWVEKEVAERMVSLGVKLLGTDTMSPDQSPRVSSDDSGGAVEDTGFGVHEVVLGANYIIAENLTNLQELKELQEGSPEGTLMVSLVPLKIAGCDGSPVRAFAWKA